MPCLVYSVLALPFSLRPSSDLVIDHVNNSVGDVVSDRVGDLVGDLVGDIVCDRVGDLVGDRVGDLVILGAIGRTCKFLGAPAHHSLERSETSTHVQFLSSSGGMGIRATSQFGSPQSTINGCGSIIPMLISKSGLLK